MPITSVTSDAETLSLTVVGDYPVPVERLWEAWADPQQIANWFVDRAEGEALPYTHDFLSGMLGTNRKSVTIAAQSLQAAGYISYRRGKITVLDRQGLEKASCECYAIVKERFDAFLTPPSTAVPGRAARCRAWWSQV